MQFGAGARSGREGERFDIGLDNQTKLSRPLNDYQLMWRTRRFGAARDIGDISYRYALSLNVSGLDKVATRSP
jgi:hypothetical protein